jgi:type III secretory pathway component EscS
VVVTLLIMSSLMGATLLHFADRLFTNFPLLTHL